MEFIINQKAISYYSYMNMNRKRKYVSQAGRIFKQLLHDKCKCENILEGDVYCYIEIHFKDKRKRDIDNYVKTIFDCLSGVCYIDDRQITDLRVKKYQGEKDMMLIKFNKLKDGFIDLS